MNLLTNTKTKIHALEDECNDDYNKNSCINDLNLQIENIKIN